MIYARARGVLGFSLAIAGILAAGCQQPVGPGGAAPLSFRLGAVAGPPAAVAPAGKSTGDIDVSRGKSVASGKLTVDLSSWKRALARRLLATLASVDHITLDLTANSLDYASATIAKADLLAGTTSYTFTNVPVGTFELHIKVYDAAGNQIGADNHLVTVQAGQVTSYQSAIRLDPSPASPTPTPVPAGGGSGLPPASPPGPGTGLTVGTTLLDGANAPIIQPFVTFPVTFVEAVIGIDRGGNAVYQDTPLNGNWVLHKASSTGSILASQSGLWGVPLQFRFDDAGNIFLRGAGTNPNDGGVWKLGADLHLIGRLPIAPQSIALDGAGHLWGYQAGLVVKYDLAGAPLASYGISLPAGTNDGEIEVDAQGNPVVMTYGYAGPVAGNPMEFCVYRLTPTGQVSASYQRPWPINEPFASMIGDHPMLQVDSSGNTWINLPWENRMVKLDPQLATATDFTTYAGTEGFALDAAGEPIGASQGRFLTRYGNDGHEITTVTFSSSGSNWNRPYTVGIDNSGAAWIPFTSSSLGRFVF